MRVILLAVLLPAMACAQSPTVQLSGKATASAGAGTGPKQDKVVQLSGQATSHGGGGTQRR